jgi:hypothetical protein
MQGLVPGAFDDEGALVEFVESDPGGDDSDAHADLGHFFDGGHAGEFHGSFQGDVVVLKEGFGEAEGFTVALVENT